MKNRIFEKTKLAILLTRLTKRGRERGGRTEKIRITNIRNETVGIAINSANVTGNTSEYYKQPYRPTFDKWIMKNKNKNLKNFEILFEKF